MSIIPLLQRNEKNFLLSEFHHILLIHPMLSSLWNHYFSALALRYFGSESFITVLHQLQNSASFRLPHTTPHLEASKVYRLEPGDIFFLFSCFTSTSFRYKKGTCLFLVPTGLREISAPNKPYKSSVMKQIMLPHTSSTAMAIICKLDLRLCFTRLLVLLHNFLIMSLEIGVCVTQKPYCLLFPYSAQTQLFHVTDPSYAFKCLFLYLDFISLYFVHLYSWPLCV